MANDRTDWSKRKRLNVVNRDNEGNAELDENGDVKIYNPFVVGNRYTIRRGDNVVTGTYAGKNGKGNHVFNYGGYNDVDNSGKHVYYQEEVSDDDIAEDTWQAFDYDKDYDDTDDGKWSLAVPTAKAEVTPTPQAIEEPEVITPSVPTTETPQGSVLPDWHTPRPRETAPTPKEGRTQINPASVESYITPKKAVKRITLNRDGNAPTAVESAPVTAKNAPATAVASKRAATDKGPADINIPNISSTTPTSSTLSATTSTPTAKTTAMPPIENPEIYGIETDVDNLQEGQKIWVVDEKGDGYNYIYRGENYNGDLVVSQGEQTFAIKKDRAAGRTFVDRPKVDYTNLQDGQPIMYMDDRGGMHEYTYVRTDEYGDVYIKNDEGDIIQLDSSQASNRLFDMVGSLAPEEAKQYPSAVTDAGKGTPTTTDNTTDIEKNKKMFADMGIDTTPQGIYDAYKQNAPSYISEEEEERRIRRSRTAKTIADLGSIFSAFANLWGTNNGAVSQQVAFADAPDYQKYRDKWKAQRDVYKAYIAKGPEYVLTQLYKLQNQKNEENAAYYKSQYWKAMAEGKAADNTYDQQKAADAAQKAQDAHQAALDKKANDDRNYQLNLQKFRAQQQQKDEDQAETRRTHMVNEQKNGSKSTTTTSSASTSSALGKNEELYTGGDYNYALPKGTDKTRMEKLIISEMIKNRELDRNKYMKNPDGTDLKDKDGKRIVEGQKTDAELIAEAKQSNKWGKTAASVIQRYGGRKIGKVNSPSKTPAKSNNAKSNNAKSNNSKKQQSASSQKGKNNDVANGGTGVWGDKINRHKNNKQ